MKTNLLYLLTFYLPFTLLLTLVWNLELISHIFHQWKVWFSVRRASAIVMIKNDD